MGLRNWVTDVVIRRRMALDRIDTDRFQVRVARTVEEYERAFRLVQVGYVLQGIVPVEELGSEDKRVTEQHMLPEATVFVAYEGDDIVGTMTVTLDSPAGLPLDKDYPDQLTELRQSGAHLAEIGSMAIIGRCQGSGVAQLLSLACARWAWQQGATHHVVGVHPKARPFFRAMWGFMPLGPVRDHVELNAPVTGLEVSLERVQAHLKRHHRAPMADGHLPEEIVFGDAPVPFIELPHPSGVTELARWKMPRGVFQSLFVRPSNRVDRASRPVRAHLRRNRTDATIGRVPLRRGA
jgi:GNAT superfamily N-acetyltransferase